MILIDYCASKELSYKLQLPRYSNVSYIDITLAIQEMLRPGTVMHHIPSAATELAEICFKECTVVDTIWHLCTTPFQRKHLTYHPNCVVRVRA